MKKTLSAISAAGFWLLLWQLAAIIIDRPLFLPPPLSVLFELLGLMRAGAFYMRLVFSFSRIISGFLIGATLGIGLGLIAKKYAVVRMFFTPFVTAVKTVPVASFIVLALFWFSSGHLPVFICSLMAFPVFYINFLQGMDQRRADLEEMSRIFRLPPFIKFRCVTLPEVFPYLYSAVQIGFGMCWKAGIAAEVITLSSGSVGEQIYQSKIYLESKDLFAWTFAIIVCSIAFEKILLKFIRFIYERLVCLRAPALKKSGMNLSYSSELKLKPGQKFIFADNISKSFDSKNVFFNFSEKIPLGKVTCITGQSGAGKTTFLRLLCGLALPDAGKIDTENLIFSIVFQEPRFVQSISVLSNLLMVSGFSQEKIISELGALGLEGCENQLVLELSGGMKQRLSLLRALISDWDILLLDEPFKEVDLKTKNIMIDFLKNKLNSRTVVIATHDILEAKMLGASYFIDLNSNS